MNNREVAHLWANQSRSRANGSHFYFQGDTIYSYGSHFPIARHYKGVVLFTSKGYSMSTARHKRYVRGAIEHLPMFEVADVRSNPCGEHVREFKARIDDLALAAARARNPAWRLECLERTVASANDFCERFGFKTRFSMPANLEQLRERARESAKREREAKARRQAKFEADCAETVKKWLSGEPVTIPYQYGKTLLRAKLTTDGASVGAQWAMQTSRGVIVPLSEAEKAFRFAVAMRNRGWHRNGEQFKIGEYQLDAVNAQGVVAGCHRVAWDEIERFAKSQGWM